MNAEVMKSTMAYIFLYAVALVAVGVIAYQVLDNQTPSLLFTGLVTTVMGYAINAQGVTHGVSATNATTTQVAAATAAQVTAASTAAQVLPASPAPPTASPAQASGGTSSP